MEKLELVFAGSFGRIRHARVHTDIESVKREVERIGKRANLNKFPPQVYRGRENVTHLLWA